MMLVYVLVGEQGSYSDYSKWVIGVCDSLDRAYAMLITYVTACGGPTNNLHHPGDIVPGQKVYQIGGTYHRDWWEPESYSVEVHRLNEWTKPEE